MLRRRGVVRRSSEGERVRGRGRRWLVQPCRGPGRDSEITFLRLGETSLRALLVRVEVETVVGRGAEGRRRRRARVPPVRLLVPIGRHEAIRGRIEHQVRRERAGEVHRGSRTGRWRRDERSREQASWSHDGGGSGRSRGDLAKGSEGQSGSRTEPAASSAIIDAPSADVSHARRLLAAGLTSSEPAGHEGENRPARLRVQESVVCL